MHYFVVDIGTTNLKVAIFKPGPVHIETMEQRLKLFTDRHGAREQQPDEILSYLVVMIKRALMKYPDGRKIIFSTQMHSLLLADENGKILQSSMTWADQRAQMQAQYFQDSEHGKKLYEISGTPVHAMSPLLKLLYLRLAKPMIFLQEEVVYAMGIKSYLVWKLTKERVIDYGTASTTGLMDITTKKWAGELLDLVRLEETQLPKLVGATDHFLINSSQAEEYSLPDDLEFYLGSTDGALANLALPIEDEDGVVFSFGTSGALRYTSNRLRLSNNGELFCYIIEDSPQYIIGGPLNNAGNVLEWAYYQYGFTESMNFDKMIASIMSRPVREKGAIFLPYLNGERAPFWNSHMSASFHNVKMSDDRLDLGQAIFEGIFFQARLVVESLAETIGKEPNLYVNGKVFQNPEQLQWIANILNTNLYLHDSQDASLLGAAMILEQAEGKINSVKQYLSADNASLTAIPGEDAIIYNKKFARFKLLAKDHHREVVKEQKELQENLLKD